MTVKQLEDYYAGDETWNSNVAIAKSQYWVDSPLQQELLQRVQNDLPLAAMIFAKVGEGCLEWLDMKVPALGGRKPVNCMQTKEHLLRLREALMRMD
jgi:hypothetical protein